MKCSICISIVIYIWGESMRAKEKGTRGEDRTEERREKARECAYRRQISARRKRQSNYVFSQRVDVATRDGETCNIFYTYIFY